jgi:serine/threonine protein kinase
MNPQPSDSERTPPTADEPIAGPTASLSDGQTLPQCDSTAAPGPASLVGTTLAGRYHVVRLIASGGMGSVYEAHDQALNRRIALKTVLFGSDESPDAMERFRREARAAAQLDHPNIVAVYDLGDDRGLQFFTMALVDGPSLQHSVRDKGQLPPADAVEVMLPIIEAVGYAHQRHIVHRDLKPDNILLDKNGRPRVTDFGLARHLLQPGNLTGASQLLGTPRYMAPEQARNQQADIGPATDVYALGGILGYLLSGRPPIDGETLTEVLLNVVEKAPSLPCDAAPRTPAKLNDIVRKCLAKKPQDRYASAGELAAALRRLNFKDEPRILEVLPPRKKDSHAQAWILGLVVLLAGGVGGLALFAGKRPPPSGNLPKSAPQSVVMAAQVQALVKQLKDGAAEVRATAAESLGTLGADAKPAVPALIERIEDEVWSIGGFSRDNASGNTSKDAAVAALLTIAPEEVEPALVRATEAKSLRVRTWAAAKLGTLSKDIPDAAIKDGMTHRVATLVKKLNDKDAIVRHAAAVSLGSLDDEALPAIPALVDRIKDDVWTVGGITQDNATGNTSKDAALAALMKLAPEKVDDALIAASKSTNPRVKAWGAYQLKKAGK